MAIMNIFRARKLIQYRTGQYGQYFSLLELKTVQKHMNFILVQIPVIPGCSDYTKRNIIFRPEKSYHTETWFSDQKERKIFKSNISLPSFSYILTYNLSLCCCHRQKITAMLLESHFVDLLLLPLHLLR